MGYKTINVSSDNTNFFTLPGQTGEWDDTLGVLDDTVFGQTYKSSQPGLIDAKITADAFYKGFAGYNATIKAIGSTTSFTTEACTHLGSGKSYQITNTAKRVWDRATTLTVFDNGVDKTDKVLTFDYLFGTVTFQSAYSVTGPVTITGSYFPLTALAKYRSFTLTMTDANIETTDLPTAQGNSGIRTYINGLKTVSMQVDGIYNNSAPVYHSYLVGRSEVVIELSPDGGGVTIARGFFKLDDRKQSGKVGELELETATFGLFVPTSLKLSAGDGTPTGTLLAPFAWSFTSGQTTTLDQSVQIVMNGFLNSTAVYVQYLPDGGATSMAGYTASSIVSDCSLSGGYDSMNMFNVGLQINGAVTAM